MESLSAKHLISATHNSFRIKYPSLPTRRCRTQTQIRRKMIVIFSKKSAFQDFKGYANPSRLLPSTEPEVCTDLSLKNGFTPFEAGGSECLYKVKLRTSGIYGSGLSDLKAGILLCLIDEKGDSILHRIPAILINDHSNQSAGNGNSDVIHFQRGSVDEFTFRGPNLGMIDALWIGLESGQWRPGSISLIVTYHDQPTSEDTSAKSIQYISTEYSFEVDETLLGEGSDISMLELRPYSVKEFRGDNLTWVIEKLVQADSITNDGITNEESMREYADLKFSLLLYDTLLVLSGSSIASFSVGENAAISFLVGGMVGFLYLFLLQRSVDGLPASGLTSMKKTGEVGEILRNFKGSVLSLVLAFAFAFAVIAVKYGSGDGALALTPKEIISGMLGFLVCKVAVVLAAFKTMPMNLEENK